MRKLLLPFLLFSSMLFAQDDFTDNPVYLDFEQPLGVDPVYSTPTAATMDYASSFPETHHQEMLSGGSAAKNLHYRPFNFFGEHFGQHRLKGTNSRVEFTNIYLTMPLVDPRVYHTMGWHLDVKLNMRYTWLNSTGPDFVDEGSLYTNGLLISVNRKLGQKGQFIFGLTPQLSTDFDVLTSSSFYFGAYVAFAYEVSDRLRFTLGVSYMSRYYEHDLFPLIGLSWEAKPNWFLRVEATRLSYMNKLWQGFEWGPFLQWNSLLWTVKRDRRTQQMHAESFTAGVSAQYLLSLSGGEALMIMADVGMNLDQEIEFRDKRNSRTIDRYKGETGFYARFGIELYF